MYAGTTNMDTSLFGTMGDGSTSTRHFVSTKGIPFVLDVPTTTQYAIEAKAIDQLFPDIVGFGVSGGTKWTSYYATNVRPVYAFKGDVFGAAVATPAIAPRVEVYDSACARTVE
jgi:hypothetical protein